MKKYFLTIILATLIVPQLAFAAWWNPLTWKVFQRTESKTQVLENRVKELEKKLESKVSTTTTATVIEKAEKKSSATEKKQNEKVQEKIVTPIKTAPKTFTLPNGSVVDEAGNVVKVTPVEQTQVKTTPNIDNVATARHYYDTKKTCVGLDGDQYSECISYAYNLPSNNTIPSSAVTPITPSNIEKSNLQVITDESNRLNDKKLRLNEINLKIANLNAKYLKDIEAVNEGARERAITRAGLATQINEVNNRYNIDYNKLFVEYQQVQYGD